MALMVGSSLSNQSGAALGAMAFPVIGPLGVVIIRQVLSAVILVPLVRPRFRQFRRDQWILIIVLALVFAIMNLTLYTAVERIGLGLAVTLEFLGPLAVAVLASRHILDIACAVAAGAGVVLLTDPGPSSDLIGIGLALIAALCWASYILINRSLGQRLPGLQGTAAASAVTALVFIPIGIVWFSAHPPALAAVGLAVGCGVLSSIVPYASDLVALRRVPAHLFGIFTSLNPVWAAIAGWIVLGQSLAINEWAGVAIIVLSGVVVSVRTFLSRR